MLDFAAALHLVAALTLAAPPKEVEVAVSGSIVTFMPQGAQSVVIVNRGSEAGVEIGDRVVHIDGDCRVREVYQFRSKCVVDSQLPSLARDRSVVVYIRKPPTPPPARDARVLSRAPDEDGTSLELDLGYVHGVRLDDEGLVEGRPCRVWEVSEATSWCATELRPVTSATVSLSPSALPGKPTTAGLSKWTKHPYDNRAPTPGVASPARPVEVLRIRREGLRASRSCVGVTPDGARSYWLASDPTPEVQPLPNETGLALSELVNTTGQPRRLERFGPLEVARMKRHLESLIADKGLEACHLGGTKMLDPDGEGPLAVVQVWASDHGHGRATYLYLDDDAGELHGNRLGSPAASRPLVVLAPLPPEPDADPTAGPRYPWISEVLFRPGEARHLVRIDGRWHTVEIAP